MGMRVIKRWLRSDASVRFGCWLINLYTRLVWRTGRWTIEGADIPLRFHGMGRSVIVAFWHSRLLMMPYAWHHGAPFHMLISAHRDGRLTAGAVKYFGIEWIAGSSSEGGEGAMRQMLRRLKAGDCVGITPDGPDGPAMRTKPGIVAVAKLSGAPMIPLAYATSRRRILNSWDRFHLPLPFTRGLIIWGEPVMIAAPGDEHALEQSRLAIEQGLNAITAEADRRMGHEAIPPGTLNRAAFRDLKRAGQGR
jgi:lysophospholipid acyltransferase (LPLAT)-like uncharacterized protein